MTWCSGPVVSVVPREPLSDCLKDVDLIPPFNRMLLEVTFGKLYSWAIHNVRAVLLEAGARFKELGEDRGRSKVNGAAGPRGLTPLLSSRRAAGPPADHHQREPGGPESGHRPSGPVPPGHDPHAEPEARRQQPEPAAQLGAAGAHAEPAAARR